jgi:hypothetical protein
MKMDEIAGAFPSPSTRAKWAKDAELANAAEAKRQAEKKKKELEKNTGEVDRLQKINHHSLAAEIPTKEGYYRSQGSSSAYDRDYASSIAGMDKKSSFAYRQDGGGNDEDHEGDRRREREAEQGPWYLRIDGKILKSKGEVKVFDWKKGANNYALAILKNKPELKGKIMLTKRAEDE